MRDISYLTDHYDEKIKKINDLDAELNFVFITDMHHNMNKMVAEYKNRTTETNNAKYEDGTAHVRSIQYIIDRCPEIDFVLCGGDIGNDYDSDPEKVREGHREIMDALYSLSVPLHCVIGNHDDALGVSTSRGLDNTKYAILPHELHSLCMKNNPTDENYYYVDFEDAGIRFVFLNTSDKPYHKDDGGQYPFGWRLEVSDKQVKWFEDEALATDKSIFIVSHSPIHNDGIFGTEGGPEYIKPYDDLLNGPRLYYDIKRSPNVVAMLAGHVHFDNIVYDDRIPVITTLCSLVQEWAPICPKREYGTITETAFDVFSIKGNNIYITRFGAGEDRTAIMLRRGK